jgi:histidyl-tRNA synthetase
MQVTDIALQTNEQLFQVSSNLWNTVPQGRFQLTDDLWVGKLAVGVAKKVIDSCEPPGLWEFQPVRQYAQLYAFGRDVGDSTDLNWDPDNRLYTCIALSRIVHPTTISLAYAVRLMDRPAGLEIVPGPIRGHSSSAFLAAEGDRDWLTDENLDELKVLLAKLEWKTLPNRIRRAIQGNDYAAGEQLLDFRWTTMTAALEGLVHTDRRRSTAQFVGRVERLASDLGLLNVAAADLEAIYDLRSVLAHGGAFSKAHGETLRLYNLMSLVLRSAVKKAIVNESFRNVFSTDETVRSHFTGAATIQVKEYRARAVRGTRDLLPPDTALWNFVEAAVRDVFRAYNFQEIRTPIFEETALFARGVGEETDIVAKEMYTWEDRARAASEKGQSLTLRPENTAGVVRAYIEHKLWDRGLNKLYYIGPQFRRERPQKGRYRQFYQIGAEVIGPASAGSESPARDAEVLEMLATLLDRVGITDWNLELNSVGTPADRAQFNDALRSALDPVKEKMCDDCQRRAVTNPLRVFDCKVPADQPIIETLPRITQFLGEDSRKHFEAVQDILTKVGVRFSLNDRLVRGLDYYTRTAFEFTHGALGAQNAILGGGRYDGLSEALGGPAAPGIGFAIGEDRLVMSLKETAEGVIRKPDVYVAPMAGMNGEAARLARELRRHDLVIELGDDGFRLKKSFEAATKAGAKYILIVGESEVKADAFALKNLATGEQISVPRAELAGKIQG